MINRQLKMTMAPRGALLVVTLLSALAVSGCGDKNEREFIRGCKSGVVVFRVTSTNPPSLAYSPRGVAGNTCINVMSCFNGCR